MMERLQVGTGTSYNTYVTDTHAQLGSSKSWVLTRERPCHRSYVRVVHLWRNGWRLTTTSSSTHNRSCRHVWSIGDNGVVQIYAGQSWINFNQQVTRGRKQGASASTFSCVFLDSVSCGVTCIMTVCRNYGLAHVRLRKSSAKLWYWFIFLWFYFGFFILV